MKGLFHIHDPSVHQQKKQFEWGEHLGSGTYGEVSRCFWKDHDPPMDIAMKVVPKHLVPSRAAQVHIMDLLRSLHHSHIINLVDWFESREHYYIVFELATGGELFDQIMKDSRYPEDVTRIMVRDIVDAIAFCHDRQIVHRDLKPENFLLRRKNAPPFDVIVADFGVAHELTHPDEKLTTIAGSPGYTAPEVYMLKGYGKEVDIWSIGVITFILLAGRFPFKHLEGSAFIAEASVDDICFPKNPWSGISETAKDFIRHCLRFSPHDRLTALECLGHEWLKSAPPNPNAQVPEPIMPGHPPPPHKKLSIFGLRKSRSTPPASPRLFPISSQSKSGSHSPPLSNDLRLSLSPPRVLGTPVPPSRSSTPSPPTTYTPLSSSRKSSDELTRAAPDLTKQETKCDGEVKKCI